MDIICQQLRPQFDYIWTHEKAFGIAQSSDEDIVSAAKISARMMPENNVLADLERLIFELEIIAENGGLPCLP